MKCSAFFLFFASCTWHFGALKIAANKAILPQAEQIDTQYSMKLP
jgi:hypothetical protein